VKTTAHLFVLMLGSTVSLVACAKPSEPPAPAPVALVWNRAKAHVFDLSLSTTSKLEGAPAANMLVLSSQAELSFGGSADKPQLLVRLLNPRFNDVASQPGMDAQALATELQKPYAIELSRGLISAYLEPAANAAPVAGFRRHIAAALQLGEHAPQSIWRGTEWDATGLAKVEYREKPGVAGAWDFSKLGYERLVLTEQRQAQGLDTRKLAPKVESATGQLVTDASGIVRVQRSESLSVPISGTTKIVTSTVLELKRSGFAEPVKAEAWTALLQDTQRAEVGAPAPVFNQALTDQARIGSHTFPELVAKLKELDAKKNAPRPTAAEAGPLFHALVGIFRQQPQTIAPAVELIRSRAAVGETLLDALAMASSGESLRALDKLVLDKSLLDALRERAAASLIRAHRPDSGALETTAKMLEEPLLFEHGLYGTGSFVRQLREQGNVAAADAGSKLLARELARSKNPRQLSTALLAISNSGSAELFEPAVSYQAHADATVRRAAIQAIRLMPQAEPRLRELLGRKERGDVEAALHSLGRRPQASRESVDRVENLAKHDPSADVRREAVLVLGVWSASWPALLPVIAQIREHDSDARVRDVAKPVAAQ
jgi:hypothetical protein